MTVDEQGTSDPSMIGVRRKHAIVALEITEQDWDVLGLGDEQSPNVEASSSISVTAERITSLLVVRLIALAAPKHNFLNLSTTTICNRLLDVPDITSIWPSTITEAIVAELRTFVKEILKGYNFVPYHNFEHCYHVLISANKLMDLVLTSKSLEDEQNYDENLRFEDDPLMQLSLLFAALIHDVEHQGVPNTQLVNENSPLAIRYNDQSIAEQQSLFIGFNELLKPQYDNLRTVMFPFTFGSDSYRRFRLAVTNLVLATDISSLERSDIVRKKWKEAFEIHTHETKSRVLSAANKRKQRPGNAALAPPPEHPTPHRRKKTIGKNNLVQHVENHGVRELDVNPWVEIGATPSTHFPTATAHSTDDSLIFWWFTPHDESEENGESTDDDASFSEETPSQYLHASDDFTTFLAVHETEDKNCASRSELDVNMSLLQESAASITMSFSDSHSYPNQSQEFRFNFSSDLDDSNDVQHLLSPTMITRHGRFNRSADSTSSAKRNEISAYSDLSRIQGSDSFLSSMPKGVFGALSFGSKLMGRKQRQTDDSVVSDVPETDSLDLTSTDVSSTCSISCALKKPSDTADDDERINQSRDTTVAREEQRKEPTIVEDIVVTRDEKLRTMSLLEHILLVSDVAHTMQGWTVMNKFALRLAKEIQVSMDAGRSGSITTDPLSDWYSNQSGFLHGYIKPLAERAEKTGFIPVSIDRKEPFLTTRVQANCDRWQEHGHDVVSGWRRERQHAKGAKFPKEKLRKSKSSTSSSDTKKHDALSKKTRSDSSTSTSKKPSSSNRPPKDGSTSRVRRTKSEGSERQSAWRNPVASQLEAPIRSRAELDPLKKKLHQQLKKLTVNECEPLEICLEPFARPIPRAPTD